MPASGMPPPVPPVDRDLAVRARDGDRAAWGELYARYADRLFDYAARLTGSRAQAADCVQDAFILAVERIGQLRDPDKVRPWLYAIVRSTAHRHYRRANRFSMQDVPDLPGDETDDVMVQGITDHELAALLDEAARGLTDEDREVLDLSLRHHLSAADIADALGVSSRHASVTTERMRERLGRSVIVTVLSRKPECAEFAAMKRMEGELTPLSRKRLARHVDSCDVCADQRDRQVRPEALLGVLPLLLIPKRAFADFDERLDEALRRRGSATPPADGGLEWDDHGFPVVRRARRARWLPWVAASMAGVLLGAGVVAVTRREPGGSSVARVAAGETTIVTAAPLEIGTTVAPTPPPASSSPATDAPSSSAERDTVDTVVRPLSPPTTASPDVPGTDAAPPVPESTVRPATPTTRPPSTQPPATPPPATQPPPTSPDTPSTPPAATNPPATVPATIGPPVTAAPTTPPPTAPPTTADTAGPAIGAHSVSAAQISTVYGGSNATCPARPTSSTITVPVSDPAGVSTVTYAWSSSPGGSGGAASGGGSMSPAGGGWAMTIGPIDSARVPSATPAQEGIASVTVTITARDTLGNQTVAVRAGVVTANSCYVIL